MPPETPIRDIVDRCRVWESHADSHVWRISKPRPDPTLSTYVVGEVDRGVHDLRVAAVTTPQSTSDQVDNFCRRLMASAAAPAPTPAPEPPAVEKLLQRLVATACSGSSDWIGRIGNFAQNSAFGESGAGVATSTGILPTGLECSSMLLLWQGRPVTILSIRFPGMNLRLWMGCPYITEVILMIRIVRTPVILHTKIGWSGVILALRMDIVGFSG